MKIDYLSHDRGMFRVTHYMTKDSNGWSEIHEDMPEEPDYLKLENGMYHDFKNGALYDPNDQTQQVVPKWVLPIYALKYGGK